jgi:hypothetical protein
MSATRARSIGLGNMSAVKVMLKICEIADRSSADV